MLVIAGVANAGALECILSFPMPGIGIGHPFVCVFCMEEKIEQLEEKIDMMMDYMML